MTDTQAGIASSYSCSPVIVTKYRHPVFTSRHLERMEQIMRHVSTDFGCELAEFNGKPSTSTCW